MLSLLLSGPFLWSLFFVSSWVVSAADFPSANCVDPVGFNTCYSKASTAAATCFSNNCGNTGQCVDPDNCASTAANCVTACVCIAYQSWMNCIYSYCWNQAVTCNAQRLVVNAFINCPYSIGGIETPYLLHAASVPHQCSCDLGAIYFRAKIDGDQATACEGAGSASPGVCACCGYSDTISYAYNICPNTAMSAISVLNFPSFISSLQGQTCMKALTPSVNCLQYGFQPPGPSGSPFFNGAMLPVFGTQSLSDTPGTLTAPQSATLIWSFLKGIPITAIAASAPAAGTQASSAQLSSAVPASSMTGSAITASSSTPPTSAANGGGGSSSMISAAPSSATAMGTTAPASGTTAGPVSSAAAVVTTAAKSGASNLAGGYIVVLSLILAVGVLLQ